MICRHCKSPARGRPCWYYLDHPEYAISGGDPPCVCDKYREDEHGALCLKILKWLAAILFVIEIGIIVYATR